MESVRSFVCCARYVLLTRLPGLWLAILITAGCGSGNGTDETGPALEARSPAQGVKMIARTGTPPPLGSGRVASLDAPFLNNQGQLLFAGEIDDPRGDLYDAAIFMSDGTGPFRQLLRTGDSLPDGERFGRLMLTDALVLNHAGQAALWLTNDADWNERGAIYRIDSDGRIIPIYNVADQAATRLDRPLLNDRGQIVIEVVSEADDGHDSRIYRFNADGSRTRLFGAGDTTPDGGYRLGTANQIGSSLTEHGWVSFLASPNLIESGGSSTHAFYRSDGSGLIELARRGEPAVAPGEIFESLHHVRYSTLDDTLRTVFHGRTRQRGEAFTRGGLFMHTNTGLVALAREREAAPGGGRFESVSGVSISINERGEFAFRARLDDNQTAVFLARSDGTVDRIAATGQELPEGNTLAGGIGRPVINAQGRVAFHARTSAGQWGVFVGEPGAALRTVAIEGQRLDGAQILDIKFAGNEPGRNGFNDHDQVAFAVSLENGQDHYEAIVLIQPDGYLN